MNIGFALCGSFCTYASDLYTSIAAVEEIYRAYLARTEIFL